MQDYKGFKRFSRRAKWIFSNSGVLSLGLEHFLAMIPSTILVPILINSSFDTNVIDISLVLFTSGLGTILFTIISKGKIPAYVGSSFAYIGLTVYLIESQTKNGVSPHMAFAYVGWAYVFSGILLILFSFLYKKSGIEKVMSFLLPASVVGPAISLIGLELADTAVANAGFDVASGIWDGKAVIVAMVTLAVIILFSLLKHKLWKNASIIVGLIAGYITYFIVYGFPQELNINSAFFVVPEFNIPFLTFPQNWTGMLTAVIPATFIVFTENIGRVTVINRMKDDDGKESVVLFNKDSMEALHSGLLSHGVATVAASFLGSVPNTIYAENIAVMGIHNGEPKKDPDKFITNLTDPFSFVPYLIAAGLAILFSFVGVLRSFLENIPKPVIGGMELFLFGIISAPGIQLLVDQRVNYKKISNQIITAAVLITGVSGLSVNFGIVELKGMSLGFVVGVVLNLIVQLLKWVGNTCDTMSFEEMLEYILDSAVRKCDGKKVIQILTAEKKPTEIDAEELLDAVQLKISYVTIGGERISSEFARDTIKHSLGATLFFEDEKLVSLTKTANSLFVEFTKDSVTENIIESLLNDHPDAVDLEGDLLRIDTSQNIPMRKIRDLVSATFGISKKGNGNRVNR